MQSLSNFDWKLFFSLNCFEIVTVNTTLRASWCSVWEHIRSQKHCEALHTIKLLYGWRLKLYWNISNHSVLLKHMTVHMVAIYDHSVVALHCSAARGVTSLVNWNEILYIKQPHKKTQITNNHLIEKEGRTHWLQITANTQRHRNYKYTPFTSKSAEKSKERQKKREKGDKGKDSSFLKVIRKQRGSRNHEDGHRTDAHCHRWRHCNI